MSVLGTLDETLTLPFPVFRAAVFWHAACPFCRQGRLYVLPNATTDRLCLHCQECERGFAHPDRLAAAGWTFFFSLL